MKKEKELQKNGDQVPNPVEYEDCRSLQERGLPALNGLYREDDWDSRYLNRRGRVGPTEKGIVDTGILNRVNQVMWTTRKQRKVERTVCTTEV